MERLDAGLRSSTKAAVEMIKMVVEERTRRLNIVIIGRSNSSDSRDISSSKDRSQTMVLTVMMEKLMRLKVMT